MKKASLVFILSLFIFFVILMLAQSQGYYKTRSEKAKILTDQQIAKFEEDINAGKEIDVNKYVLYEDKDYTSGITNNVYKISLRLENVFNATVRLVFNGASKAVND